MSNEACNFHCVDEEELNSGIILNYYILFKLKDNYNLGSPSKCLIFQQHFLTCQNFATGSLLQCDSATF
jgi:hypothetical protein